MRCQQASAATGPRGMLQGGRTIAGLFGVKGQPGIIVAAEIAQSLPARTR